MRVLQAGGGGDLLDEPLGAQNGRQIGTEDFDRDLPPMTQVLGEVDGGHAAMAELTLDPIAVGQPGPEPVERLRTQVRRAGLGMWGCLNLPLRRWGSRGNGERREKTRRGPGQNGAAPLAARL